MDDTDEPFVRVDDEEGGGVVLWLEPCEGDEDIGLVIGVGESAFEAIASAREALAAIARQLDRLERERTTELEARVAELRAKEAGRG